MTNQASVVLKEPDWGGFVWSYFLLRDELNLLSSKWKEWSVVCVLSDFHHVTKPSLFSSKNNGGSLRLCSDATADVRCRNPAECWTCCGMFGRPLAGHRGG